MKQNRTRNISFRPNFIHNIEAQKREETKCVALLFGSYFDQSNIKSSVNLSKKDVNEFGESILFLLAHKLKENDKDLQRNLRIHSQVSTERAEDEKNGSHTSDGYKHHFNHRLFN